MKNPGAFLRSFPNAENLLRICGCPAQACSQSASDYEFFEAFCKVSGKLSHNRLLLAAEALLSENGLGGRPFFQNAQELWLAFSNLETFREPPETAYLAESFCGAPPESTSPGDWIDVESLILQAKASTTLLSFEKALLEAFHTSLKKGVSVALDDARYGKQPNPHTVAQALRGEGDPSSLYLQALRIFSKQGIPMLVFLRGSGEKTLAFLDRLDDLVGISRLDLVLTPDSFENGTAFLLSHPVGQIRPVLQERDLATLAGRLYDRYPIGCVRLFLQEL